MQRGAIGSQVSLFRDATKQLKETLRVTSADLNLTMQIEIKDASHASDEPSNPS